MIGCGAFGQFCLEAFSKLPDVRIVAVADTVEELARAAGERFGAKSLADPAALAAMGEVDVIHVATPPSTHHDLVLPALRAGKHVLCEKPLATEVSDAAEMLAAAKSAGVHMPVNFVLRHNAVTDAVAAVLESGVLGEVLAAWLVNCAADSNLPADHWFWDREVSGGIFIEHGVHFFDLYRHWLGAGELLVARTHMRPGTDQQDRVECTVRHGQAVVHHYHGFDQIGAMDRTRHRFLCELGDIRVAGWIPLTMTVDAALDDAGLDRIMQVCPGATVEYSEPIPEPLRDTRGRGKARRVTRRVQLSFTPEADKQAVYAASAAALLADQIAAIRDPNHQRRVTDHDGYEAVRLAAAARDIAAREAAQ